MEMNYKARSWLNMCADFGSNDDRKNAKYIITYIETLEFENELLKNKIKQIETELCQGCKDVKNCVNCNNNEILELLK